jgi:hypothetical protein
MRRILFSILALVVISIAATSTFTSCNNETKHSDTLPDTTVIGPQTTPADSAGETLSVTGKVVDGAMNSVFIEVEPDSSVEFSYPQLDRNDSEVFYNWSIDDEVTIEYVHTMRNGEQIDSVISIQKAE